MLQSMACRKDTTPFTQKIKGIVSEVNEPLLFFEVDKRIRIYVDVSKPSLTFPAKDKLVEISNIINFTDVPYTAVMGPKTTYNFSTTNTKDPELLYALKANEMCDPEEIVAMDRVVRKLRFLVSEACLSKCLINLLHEIPVLGNKKSFKKLQIKLPNHLNYVNRSSELYTFMKFDQLCNYNVYPSENPETSCLNVEYLFGILDVDDIYGCFSLTDKQSKMLVKFTPYASDLYKFKKTLVMIKKWTVFTEVFNLTNVPTLKCILINFEDVVIVESLAEQNEQRLFYGKDDVCQVQAKMSKFFQINRMSEVICGYNGVSECWIEGYISDNGPTRSPRDWVYVCLSNLSLIPFLKELVVYKLFYNENPTHIQYNPELWGLKTTKRIFMLGSDTIFQETYEIPYPQNEAVLKSIQEVKNYIFRIPSNQFFSVSLKIGKKKLQENRFKSWYPKRYQIAPYFGNLDDRYQMRLLFYDSDSNEYLDLYLTNRDNHITPLGLVENVIVKVKHVQHNKSKYLKTTVFTSFEILGYSPKMNFSSVNLSFDSLGSWNWRTATPATLLGLYYHLPLLCIVHGSFVFQAIFDLRITPICLKCQKRVVAGRPCWTCKIEERDLHVAMTIYVQDSRNPTFNIDTDKQFLYALLGLKKAKEVQYFCNAFYKSHGLQIDFCKCLNFRAESFTRDPDSKEFLQKLVDTIYKDINFNLYAMVDAVCVRKMARNPWNMVQFEIIYNGTIGDM